MKKVILLSFVVVTAGLFNVGCTAKASIHGTNATKFDNTRQVAYVGNPAR